MWMSRWWVLVLRCNGAQESDDVGVHDKHVVRVHGIQRRMIMNKFPVGPARNGTRLVLQYAMRPILLVCTSEWWRVHRQEGFGRWLHWRNERDEGVGVGEQKTRCMMACYSVMVML